MTQLIITVMAIVLAAIFAVGGLTYFSTNIGVRVSVQHALRSQHGAILTAVSSYRTANNGYVHPDIKRLHAYMPDGRMPVFPGGGNPFVWSIEKDGNGQFLGLCLNRPEGEQSPLDNGVAQGVVAFVTDRAARGTVSYGRRPEGNTDPCAMAGGREVTSDSSLTVKEIGRAHV